MYFQIVQEGYNSWLPITPRFFFPQCTIIQPTKTFLKPIDQVLKIHVSKKMCFRTRSVKCYLKCEVWSVTWCPVLSRNGFTSLMTTRLKISSLSVLAASWTVPPPRPHSAVGPTRLLRFQPTFRCVSFGDLLDTCGLLDCRFRPNLWSSSACSFSPLLVLERRPG
jgi:hypothetical protein